MKTRFIKLFSTLLALSGLLIILMSCEDLVEKGYRIDYNESDAELVVEAIGDTSAAVGETISFRIEVSSNTIIKSCIIQSNKPGAGGSGYDVGTVGFDDPFADHNFGTIKKNITSFVVKYNYVVPKDVNSSKLIFSVIDELGKKSDTIEIVVVPTIKKYSNKKLYAKNRLYNDAFATIDGLVYPNIKTNFSSTSEENTTVQEKIDVVFFVDNGISIISSPAYSGLNLDLNIENDTKFKKLSNISHEMFENITASSLVGLTKSDSISYYGSSAISGVKVGDIIGFTTDLNAVHALKTGVIKINQLHPTSISRYEGVSYVMECDIVTQIEE